uniref:Major facilitator superfamily (MFS) profile domain-containing protein n=1 Tax=Panagrolaimus davidi TaxID=227884 RepID=A0A914R024_9BILA
MVRRISTTDPPIPLSEIEITKTKPILQCGNKTRFIIALQGSLFLAALMGNITCWNAALIKVAEIESSPLYEDYLNGTTVDWTDDNLPFEDMRVDLSPIQISLLFAASFAGSALFVLPATFVMKKIGTYRTQVILGSITTAAAALTPWATVTNFNLLLVLRLIQGMCQCNPYPVIGAIVTTWAAPKEKGIFVALLTGYTQLCAVITTPIASYLANHYGWPSVFYFQAAFCGFFLVLWVLNYRDDPETHWSVSEKEFRKISTGKMSAVELANVKVPFYRVLTKMSVWACIIGAICYIYAAQFTISFLVMYLVWVMKWPITIAGSLSALPLVVQFSLQFCTGLLSDKITFINEHTKIRLFCTLTFTGTGIGLILLTFIPSSNTLLSTIITIISLSFLGFNAGGFPKSAVLISTRKPASVMGFVQAALTFGLLTGSFIVPILTPDRSFPEYSNLFRIYGALLIAANIFFVIFCRAETENFAYGDEISDITNVRVDSVARK